MTNAEKVQQLLNTIDGAHAVTVTDNGDGFAIVSAWNGSAIVNTVAIEAGDSLEVHGFDTWTSYELGTMPTHKVAELMREEAAETFQAEGLESEPEELETVAA